MDKLYKKSPENFAFVWIGFYCIVQSIANGISKKIGIPYSANAVLALAQSLWLLRWLRNSGRMQEFQLRKPTRSAKKMLWYLPLILISSSNLWQGVRWNLTPAALGIHILLMLNVGFLEELIFRGFLFEALRKKSLRSAVLVSSLTFGAGHLMNLFNGSGMSAADVLFQVIYACLVGLLFVMVYLRSGSLIPCIVSHQTINILSAFADRQVPRQILSREHLIGAVLIVLYLLYLKKAVPVQGPDRS